MGKEEKKREQKEERKKETGSRLQPSYLDHSIASYDSHGSYDGPILNPRPSPQGDSHIKIKIRIKSQIMTTETENEKETRPKEIKELN